MARKPFYSHKNVLCRSLGKYSKFLPILTQWWIGQIEGNNKFAHTLDSCYCLAAFFAFFLVSPCLSFSTYLFLFFVFTLSPSLPQPFPFSPSYSRFFPVLLALQTGSFLFLALLVLSAHFLAGARRVGEI